jgi:hypothetical protein
MSVRDELIAALWKGADPFAGAPLLPPDGMGYSTSQHRYLAEAVRELRPRVIVEIGVWKGVSAMVMGRAARDLNLDCAIIAIDTWLGSAEHWIGSTASLTVDRRFGYPMTYYTFLSNVMHDKQAHRFVPLPLDSTNAYEVLRHHGIVPDVIHIDAGHDYRSVMNDLTLWWPMLREGGVLLGDDYYTGGQWPGVRRAFDEFFGSIEHDGGKCRVRKPTRAPLQSGQ